MLDTTIAIAREAGVLLLEGFFGGPSDEKRRFVGRRQSVDTKGSDIDLVTVFDRRSEEHIVSRLHRAFPGDAVLAEEGGLTDGAGGGAEQVRWLIDPLDGTTNFAHGLPLFCVSMARERGGVIEIAVVHAPALDLTFAAQRGGGATLNGEPIHVSTTATLGRAMLATGFPYDRHTSDENNFAQFIAFQRRAQAVRRLGSAALDLSFVAAGTYDGYWEMKLKPWDLAAGALLVEEAGGRVSNWSRGPVDLDRGAALASNGLLHDEMAELLATLPLPSAAR